MCTWCDAFEAAGGVIQRCPFGMSGLAERSRFLAKSREKALTGWLARFGLRSVPEDAVDALIARQISIVVARVEIVWTAARDRNPVPISVIANRTHINPVSCSKTASFLVGAHRMAARSFCPGRGGRPHFLYQSLGEAPPHWSEFIEKRAA